VTLGFIFAILFLTLWNEGFRTICQLCVALALHSLHLEAIEALIPCLILSEVSCAFADVQYSETQTSFCSLSFAYESTVVCPHQNILIVNSLIILAVLRSESLLTFVATSFSHLLFSYQFSISSYFIR